MSKRTAERQLTADNWDDDEDPPEESTGSVIASEEVLNKRVIKVAKRRIQGSIDEAKQGIFQSFAGFKKTPSSDTSPSPFSFLSKLANGSNDKPNPSINLMDKPSESKPVEKVSTKFEIKQPPLPSLNLNAFKTAPSQTTSIVSEKNENSETDEEYCSNLKSLNLSVCEWIKSHIDKNPYCVLTPIFDDYKKYLSELDKTKAEKNNNKNVTITKSVDENKQTFAKSHMIPMKPSETPSFLLTSPVVSEPPKLPSFMTASSPQSTMNDKLDLSKFSTPGPNLLGQGFASTPLSKSPNFNFGTKLTEKTATGGFSFGGAAPFTFANTPQSTETKTEEDEEEEPPKASFTPVVEEGAVFSKRCKVFVKKENNYSDRGVGTLYLKPIADSEKYQLIVRADTSLGNLLLNIVLSSSLPLQRLGKNNVMMMCIPTPDSKPPPVSTLLRVKTGDEADELLETLKKYQK